MHDFDYFFFEVVLSRQAVSCLAEREAKFTSGSQNDELGTNVGTT